MGSSKFKLSSAFLLVTLLAIGCASAKYIGQSYQPTTNVDLYYSEKEIEKEYTTIGHAVGSSGLFGSDEKVVEELIEKAKSVGADAIVLKGIDLAAVPGGEASHEETRITASFLKYR